MATNEFIKSFLYNIASKGKGPGIISMSHEKWSKPITGILASEVSVSAQNTYGSLIPDISGLTDLASIGGFASLPTWIGASALMWKGTAPISFGAEMLLINYAPNLGHEESLKKLTKLCTLCKKDGVWGTLGESALVHVHGGYSADPTANNADYMSGENHRSGYFSAVSKAWKDGDIGALTDTFCKNLKNHTNITGTLTVQVGDNFRIGNILLTSINVTPSLVEVAAEDERDPKPLYYRVNMSFTTCRAGLEVDVDGLFGG